MAQQGKKKRVLIIDDDQDFTSVLQIALEGRGHYEVRSENDALKALAAAKEFGPDVILLDVQMPGLGGGDIAEQFHKEPALKRKKVIFLTGQISPDEVAYYGSEIRGKLFIPKGLETEELIKRIEQSI